MTKHPEHIERLIAACRLYPGLDPRDVVDAVGSPCWSDAYSVNDWRNHVHFVLVDDWDALCLEARLVVYLQAAATASIE